MKLEEAPLIKKEEADISSSDKIGVNNNSKDLFDSNFIRSDLLGNNPMFSYAQNHN